MAYGEQLPSDSASKKFQGVLVDDGGANVFEAVAGVNHRTQNAETVADESVHVTTTSGAGATIGTITDAAIVTDTTGSLAGKIRGLVKWAFERMPASLGGKPAAASLPVTLATNEPLLSVLPASLGQKAGAASLAVIPASQQFTNPITRIVGDGLSHSLGYAAGATLAPSDDTMISQGQTGHNGGAYDQLPVGAVGSSSQARRALLRFTGLSNYALATIATATLRLRTIVAAPPAAGTLNVYAIKPANGGWVQGAQNWAAAAGTDPSWARKSQSPDTAWAGSAGLSTAGTDYHATALGSLSWTTDASTWFTAALAASLLQEVAGANHGFLLLAADETTDDRYATFGASEMAGYGPELVITVSANQKTPKRVFLLADASGATWANGAAATANDAPIPLAGIEVPYLTNDAAALAVYVPAGVNVWFAGVAWE